jgi:CheY-like chemotaxis protein
VNSPDATGHAKASQKPANSTAQEAQTADADSSFGGHNPQDSLAGMRHSLRTPLNQILGYCELLMEELTTEAQKEFLPDLQKVHTAGGQLLSLINEALAPWRLESGALDMNALRLEMRTPLNLIIGYSELCQELVEESGSLELLPDLQKISAAARNLMALFESASFPSRLDVHKRGPAILPSSPPPLSSSVATEKEATASSSRKSDILLVDDNEMNRDMLSRRLERQGHRLVEAENGLEALQLLKSQPFDLILLDVIMPRMDGYQTLQAIIADPDLKHIPVIMLSALDEADNVIRCIEIGAEDYLTKPFNPVLLNVRLNAALEKKRLRDREHGMLELLQLEQRKTQQLIANLLPKTIAERLIQGETPIADVHPSATVLFANITGFISATRDHPPTGAVSLLNEIYAQFDWLAELHEVEKIKTVADCYMAAAGVPMLRKDHASAAAEMALEMQRVIKRLSANNGMPLHLRIGLCSGPVVGGVIGRKKLIYDLWGETVQAACLLEAQGQAGSIQISESTRVLLRDKYELLPGRTISWPGRMELSTSFLTGRKARKFRLPTGLVGA